MGLAKVGALHDQSGLSTQRLKLEKLAINMILIVQDNTATLSHRIFRMV